MPKTRTRTEYAVINVASNFAGYVINTAVGFICRMVFVRHLAVEYLGVAGLFTNIIMMLSLSELGLGAVMTHALYDPIAKDDKAKIAALMQFFSKLYRLVFCFFVLIGIALIPYVNRIFKEPPAIDVNLIVVYLLFLFSTAITYLYAHQVLFLKASQKEYVITTVNYLFNIVQSCLQIIFLFLTQNYIHYLVIQVVSSVCQFICFSYLHKRNVSYDNHEAYIVSKEDRRGIFRNLWKLTIGRLSGFLVNGTDNIIIAKIVNIASVGLLSNYVLIIMAADSLLNSMMTSVGDGIGNFNALSDKNSTANLFRNISFLVFSTYGLLCVIFYVSINDIVRILFGEEYVMGHIVCALLSLNFFMQGLINLVGTYMNALGVFAKGRLILVLTAIFNIVMSIWFGQLWGVAGVLAATAVARLVTNCWYQPKVLFKYGFESSCVPYFVTYFYFLLIVLVSLFIGDQICSKLDAQNDWVSVLLNALISSLVFIACVYSIYRKTDEYSYFRMKARQIQLGLRSRSFF